MRAPSRRDARRGAQSRRAAAWCVPAFAAAILCTASAPGDVVPVVPAAAHRADAAALRTAELDRTAGSAAAAARATGSSVADRTGAPSASAPASPSPISSGAPSTGTPTEAPTASPTPDGSTTSATSAAPGAVPAGTVALPVAPGASGPVSRPAPPNLRNGPPVGCGGELVPRATGGYWNCTFDDEFSGTSLDRSLWNVQTTAASGFHSGPECFVDDPNNLAVAGGVLSLTVRKEAAPFTCASPTGSYTTQYTSGTVNTFGRFAQAYGRFEVRAALPAATVKGLQTSFWLWPQNMTKYGPTWPESGEIDIAEMYSLYPTLAIPYIHYVAAAPDPNVTSYQCTISDVSAFHTYAVEWTTASITVIYDGRTCLVDSWNPLGLVRPAPFDQPFMVALTQALGIGGNAFDPATTPLPATTRIDYVRVGQ